MSSYFLKANEKVNTDVYYKVFRYYVLLWLKRTFSRDHYVFSQPTILITRMPIP
uniref:Putative LOC100197594 [Hydra vulgaris] n=1 Tax=Lepeophtheirus salmonis TaxID=72036 RepID=A0A0K2ULI4_LEPSM